MSENGITIIPSLRLHIAVRHRGSLDGERLRLDFNLFLIRFGLHTRTAGGAYAPFFLSLVFWTHSCYHHFIREQRRTSVFNIEFYSTSDGVSELWDFLEDLQTKALTNKDAKFSTNKSLSISSCLRIMEPVWVKTSQSIWKKTYGNSGPGTTEYSFSITRMIPMFCSISSARRLRKLHAAKSTRQ